MKMRHPDSCHKSFHRFKQCLHKAASEKTLLNALESYYHAAFVTVNFCIPKLTFQREH
jgi:hypothetical protein